MKIVTRDVPPRAAWALGGTGMILPKDRTATVTAAAEKVASGALAQLARPTRTTRLQSQCRACRMGTSSRVMASEAHEWTCCA